MAQINRFERRKQRVRFALKRTANGKPRLSVFRSGKHVYAQVIDDEKNVTVASASTMDKELTSKIKKSHDCSAAEEVGKLISARATKAGVKEVVFDRGGYVYHGRVKALAEAARAGGLEF